MKKIYDVNLLLKPVRLYEQDSDATQAEDVDKKDEEEKGQEEKKDENDQKNNDGQENKEEEKNEDDQQANGNADQNNNQGQKADGQGNVQAQQNALNGVSKSLMDCSVELDNIYKNNNLKKYGMGVENAYKGVMRFVWPAIGITVAATVAFLCMKGIIPAKKVLSKVPLIGKLFQGDKAAINSVQQSLLFAGTNKATQMGTQAINNIGNKPQQAQPVGNSTVAPEAATQPATGTQDEQSAPTNTENANNQNGESSTTAPVGSNPEQKTDKAPTIENSVEAQANAKPGDVIQRKNGEKYVLNQGDINWAKQQVQKGKSKETVDQAKQEEGTGNTPTSNVQNETAPDANQQNNNNGQTTTPANDNAQQTPDQNVDANNTATQANNQSDNNGQVNANQQSDSQQSESIKDVAQQTANVANSNTNQPTNNAPTSNSTTVKNPDGSTTTTTQNNNGQDSTGTTTTTTNVEKQVGGTYAGQKAPLTEEQAKQVCQNNGLPPQYSYLITQNNCDQRQAIEAISLASVAANKLKSGKSSLDFEKEFGRQQLAQYGANCGNAFVQILQQMERNI